MAAITLTGLKKSYGNAHVIKGVDIEIADGEFCVFVGPSGCGKSTLLRIIAGLETATSGGIEIDGRDVAHAEPAAPQRPAVQCRRPGRQHGRLRARRAPDVQL